LSSGLLRNGQAPVYFIREPPGHVYFVNNSSITVHCMVGGQSPQIQWFQKKLNNAIPVFRQQPSTLFKSSDSLFQKQQSLVEQRPDGSLHFSAFPAELYGQDLHSSVYFCEASNAFGTIRSRDVHVKALIAQSHRAEVFDEYVIPGNSALFKCNLPSTLKDFVYVSQWIIDQNETIARNSLNFRDLYTTLSNGELYIRQITEKDISRTFQCETRNRLTGELSSTKGRLYLTPIQNKLAPRIVYSQNTIRVDEGERVILPCVAQSNPLPSYHWFKTYQNWPSIQSTNNNEPTVDQVEPIHPNSRIFQLDGLLVFKQALLSDNARYRCVVNNSLGTTLIETELIVTSPLFVEMIPNEVTADVGSTIQFNCSYSGHPIESIEWYHNAKPLYHLDNRISLINKNILVISKIQRQDRGIYQCIVRNEKDSQQVSTVLDLGDDAPSLLETFPTTQVIEAGVSVSLKCIASGSPLPSVTWSLDSQQIPDDSRYRIGDYVTSGGLLVSYVNITSAKTDHGGRYKCVALNEIGQVEHQGELNIYGPAIVRSIANKTVVGGERLILTCPVGGFPISNIWWEKDNWKIPFNHRQKAFPNGTLQVYQVERDQDSGQYTCFAKGKQGSVAKNSLFVSVLVRPVIDEFVFPKSLHEGQRYNVLCTVIKGDAPLEIQWLKDGLLLPTNLKSTSLKGVSSTQVTEFSTMLNFASLLSEHRGNWTCKASNSAGSTSYTAKMEIQVPPSWIIEPADSTVVKGTTSTTSCQASGHPAPRIRWSKAEEFLQTGDASSDFKPISSRPHLRVFENGSLIIYNTQKTDGGFYLCSASNGVGPGLSKVVQLSVHVAAHFKTKFKAETVQKGADVRLKCEAFGDSPIQITWTKDKLLFNAKDDVRYELIENLNSESLISELIIQDTNRKDSSLFTCIATNAYGEDQTSIQLILQESPDVPEKVRADEIDGKSAKISWKTPFSGNSIITQYLIEYQQADENWNRNTISVLNVTGSENQVVVKALKPVTQYQVRVYAQNALGKSEASEQVMFRTDEELPSGPPINLKGIPISSSIIRLTWKPPKKELQNGLITGYNLAYKIKGSNEQLQLKTVNTKVGEFNHEYQLKSLKKSSTYSITIQAMNSKGAGVTSEEISVQTYENDPPLAPTLKIITSSSTIIQVTWHIDDGESKVNNQETTNKSDNQAQKQSNSSSSTSTDVGLPVIAYVLHFKLQNADVSEYQELRLPGDRSSYLFQNLRCGSKYSFYIYAINAIDKGDSSEVITGKTEGMAPVAPDKHSLLSVNSTAVSIYLDSWHNGGCPITKFEIMYKMQRSKKWISLPMTENDVDFRRVFITSLKSSTNYDLIITATNEASSTQAQYAFSTFALIKETAITHILANNEASSSSAEDIYLNVGFILPSCISMLIILLVVLLLCVLVAKKKNNSASIYGSGLYDTTKCQSNIDTLRLSDLDNGNLKKVSGLVENGSSGLDSGYYPSPYAMTKLNGKNLSEACLNSETLTDLTCNGLNENQINTKLIERMLTDATGTFTGHSSPKKNGGEPLYATVKRTPRTLRNDLHVYHCPASTLKKNLIDSQIGNCDTTITNGINPLNGSLNGTLNGTLNGNLNGTLNGKLNLNGSLNDGSLTLNGNHLNHQIYNGTCTSTTCSSSNQSSDTGNYCDQTSTNYFHLDTDCKDCKDSITASNLSSNLSSISEETLSQIKEQQQFNQQKFRAQELNNIMTYQRRLNKHFR